MGRPTHSWDDLLIQLISSKFDVNTTTAWESILTKEPPTVKELTTFLTQRCQTLESIEVNSFSKSANQKSSRSQQNAYANTTGNPVKCVMCNKNHNLYQCQKFLSLSVAQRQNTVKQHKLCENCLRATHKTESCNSGNCRQCHKRHNSLLHLTENSNQPQELAATSSIVANNSVNMFNKLILLSTALIQVHDRAGKACQLRALLDSGSQSHFITENACHLLKLQTQKINIPVSGINQNITTITRATNIKIKSNHNNFKSILSCLVVGKITDNLPSLSINSSLNIPKNIKLADPTFNQSGQIDLLIGSALFWKLLSIGQIHVNQSGTIFQKTKLGWIVSGPIPQTSSNSVCNVSKIASLDLQLKRFWEINESHNLNLTNHSKADDELCEQMFEKTTQRDPLSGRFTVKLPFRNNPPNLGHSRELAIKRFKSLENKFFRNSTLQSDYCSFMREYLNLGHMEKINHLHIGTSKVYYLAHHPVIKESSVTTKLRVVFDGSMKTNNGQSLNDNLLTGPILQQDLFAILTRFRTHRYVITADIEKMYRQILVDKDHRNYQLVLWRDDINKPVETFRLTTVTYGCASSSYLAIKCLQELARSEAEKFPDTYRIILRDFYVDDLLTGSESIASTLKIRDEVVQILKGGGFNLHKFASNSPLLMPSDASERNHNVSLDRQPETKTLGILWNCHSDTIRYSSNFKNINKSITKRGILSTIARLFDPLGLVAPITITAKTILQKLWSLKLDWDESLPLDLHTSWSNFMRSFQDINTISIPRRIVPDETSISYEMHGFCDASQTAYGACVYIRVKDALGNFHSQLLCSKNRVTPLSATTIPRLELCGALLLAQLVDKVKQTLNLNIEQFFFWTDSTIVLAWLKMQSTTLKVFVSHRVSEIQNLTSISDWHHVRTVQNPADLLSRGTTPNQLRETALWWHGPKFLKNNEELDEAITSTPQHSREIPEIRSACCLLLQSNGSKNQFNLISKFSTFSKLVRVTAYILRFINNIRKSEQKLTGQLTVKERQTAERVVIKIIQNDQFSEEIHFIKKHGELQKTSSLRSLHPFLDKDGLLRVGGRLRHAAISYGNKHPIILPKNHLVTKLIIEQIHFRQLHAGTQATLCAVRQKFWPISGYALTRQITRSCISCRRVRPIPYQQLMGDLPASRVTPGRPFTCTGVDYAGPYILKNGHGRTNRTIKGYIVVIFICLTTRAVHIELVCDCTSSTFLNALKRFMSRRGKVLHIYSDNGTNFSGANRELKELHNLFKSEHFAANVVEPLTNDEIHWHFIPPRSPHMGGLWEAAVKSTKGHLKRVLGKTILNYEEMYTLLTMIEACLNSRPLAPLSNDPSDFEPLTPGHFLIGGPLHTAAEPDVTELPSNRLSRYQLIERLRQHFWKRWSKEILHQFQQRPKWAGKSSNQPQVGTLVVLKEDNVSPLHWPMGRITEVHPGADGLVRVVSVKTANGVLRRAISKVCALPLSD
jgi:hypothetical protein